MSAVGCISSQARPQQLVGDVSGCLAHRASVGQRREGSIPSSPPRTETHDTFCWGFEDLTICGLVWPFLFPQGTVQFNDSTLIYSDCSLSTDVGL